MRHIYFSFISVSFACSGQPEPVENPYDLPGIWSKATLIESFTQAECNENMFELTATAPRALVNTSEDSLVITYPNAHFRCDQTVQGFVKQSDDGYAILIQPVDMDPIMAAKCDCGYTLEVTLPKLKSNTIRVFHRGDNFGGESTIREIKVVSE